MNTNSFSHGNTLYFQDDADARLIADIMEGERVDFSVRKSSSLEKREVEAANVTISIVKEEALPSYMEEVDATIVYCEIDSSEDSSREEYESQARRCIQEVLDIIQK